jgi:hypothetical protein
MPVEIELTELPAGCSESSARGGGMIKVSQKGFYSSEDGVNSGCKCTTNSTVKDFMWRLIIEGFPWSMI